jgi:hypothetical protein
MPACPACGNTTSGATPRCSQCGAILPTSTFEPTSPATRRMGRTVLGVSPNANANLGGRNQGQPENTESSEPVPQGEFRPFATVPGTLTGLNSPPTRDDEAPATPRPPRTLAGLADPKTLVGVVDPNAALPIEAPRTLRRNLKPVNRALARRRQADRPLPLLPNPQLTVPRLHFHPPRKFPRRLPK